MSREISTDSNQSNLQITPGQAPNVVSVFEPLVTDTIVRLGFRQNTCYGGDLYELIRKHLGDFTVG